MDSYVFELDDIEWEGLLCQEVFRQTIHLAVTDGFLKRHKALAKLLRCREEEEAKRTAKLLEPYLSDSDMDETIEEMQERITRAEVKARKVMMTPEEKRRKSEQDKKYRENNPRPSQVGNYAKLSQEAKDARNEKRREDWADRPDDKRAEEADKDRARRKKMEAEIGLDAINAVRRAKRAARTDEEREEDSRKDKERRNRIGKEAFNAKRRARYAARTEEQKAKDKISRAAANKRWAAKKKAAKAEKQKADRLANLKRPTTSEEDSEEDSEANKNAEANQNDHAGLKRKRAPPKAAPKKRPA